MPQVVASKLNATDEAAWKKSQQLNRLIGYEFWKLILPTKTKARVKDKEYLKGKSELLIGSYRSGDHLHTLTLHRIF